MALVKCPNCNKNVSDKADFCPACNYKLQNCATLICTECGNPLHDSDTVCNNCGYPLSKTNTLNSKTKKKDKAPQKNLKRIIIIISSILVAVLIGIAIYLLATADSRNYEKAISLYNEGNYQEALELFMEIDEYKDSQKFIKECKYEMSVDGRFLKALSTGLEERWALTNEAESANRTENSSDWQKYINAEYSNIKDFANQEFNDKSLGEKAKKYISIIEKSDELIKIHAGDLDSYWVQYKPYYDERCILLMDISQNYTLTISEKNQHHITEFASSGAQVIAVRSIMETTEFEMVEDNYGWKDYEAIVENTSETEFSFFCFNINLVANDGTVLETTIASTDNWKPGSKNKFKFSTNTDFDKIVIDSCSY
jgi:ribosomal protein L37E